MNDVFRPHYGENLARIESVLCRIADALEKFTPPPQKDARRIRVQYYDSSDRTMSFRASPEVVAIAPGRTQGTIEVPRAVLYDPKNLKAGMPDFPRGVRAEFLVTVDLGPDTATWGWRDWVLL